jgi:hypothetical protein
MDEWAAQIARTEGPLHEEELLAALRDDYGYGSLGARIRAHCTGAIRTATRRGLMVAAGSWYWPPATARDLVPVRLNRGSRRRFDYCSEEELERAMLIVGRSVGRLPQSSSWKQLRSSSVSDRPIRFRNASQLVAALASAGRFRQTEGGLFEVV